MKNLEMNQLESTTAGGNGRECMIYGGLATVALGFGGAGFLAALGIAAYANDKGCFEDSAK